MRKLFLSIALLVATTAGLVAQEQEVTKELTKSDIKPASFVIGEDGQLQETTAPVIQFTEETFDFGELEEGPQVTHEFKFKNTGKEPLTLSNVKASCGCTTPDWPKTPILPGEENVIKVTYNTKGRIGAFNKAVTITSNAYTPTARIYIKGTVKAAPQEQTTPVKPAISPLLKGDQ
ncbi:MAG: DUF1573 domain-containing protein [Chitinophagales bacterium]|jgi:hypothetical protein|nr:DUF1573 domain-containing protein [Chitinophagales bacterium]HNI43146.1 DUF1573 domain-containing protein [Chitinophagales bacterium]HNL07210.1 DUF1573 domain-containing protein [Chitinophagales bacterium]